ncbi:MAG: zinc-binding dehydrogenase [Clostridia bacterium]|nr:zinc-binding dehydrogenase [Clostridia bacterium]
MATMKQIVYTKPGVAEFLDRNIPAVGAGMVAVKTVISSISCGTERALCSGDPNVSIAVAEGTPVEFPRTSGYSSAGIVLEVGEGVTDLKAGDRVAMAWSAHCEINVLSRANVYKLDDRVSFADAALCHIGTFPLAAIRKTGLEVGESMLVMGLGVLGLWAVQLGRVAGAAPVIAVDPVKERREKALSLGADYAFDPTEADFVKKVKEVTGGGVNTVIEVTGLGIGMDQSLDCMARFGRMALLGCTRNKEFHIDYYRKVHGPGITIVGAHTNARPKYESHEGWFTAQDDTKALLKLIAGGRIHPAAMVDAVFTPDKCGEVYDRLINDRNFPPVAQFEW